VTRRSAQRPDAGYTLLELLLAMAIFTFLGAMVVFLMRQGLNVFSVGTRDTNLQDRADTVIPRVRLDLEAIAVPGSRDAPPPPPTEAERLAGKEYFPPPPVDVRLRAAVIRMRDVPEGPLKDAPCPYVAFVTSLGTDRSDPLLRRAGDQKLPGMRVYDPAAADQADPQTAFLATGGLMEVCYVAVPEDPAAPAVLTLYRGFRTPIGGAGSLLDPANVDSLAEVQKACRVFERGLLHFGVTWRRIFATSWTLTEGAVGETDPYVGAAWDSTRALDNKFPLFVGPNSLGDPSDDVFPRWARLEVTLVPPTIVGYGQGETTLRGDVAAEDRSIRLENLSPLSGPGQEERWLKVGTEWMRYRPDRLEFDTLKVTVERGLRGTKAVSHRAGDEVYLGLETSTDVRLPVFLDRYARKGGPGGLR
jgi:prepilin-type N-terminal cleavage/methylation domain-containing protein